MNSSPDVTENLGVAGTLLAEAAAGGAVLAVLPENFAIMGAREADRLAVAEGTVRSRLFYALKALRLTLEEMGWHE